MAYTLADFMKLNPDYQKRYDPKTKMAYVGNAKTGKEISFLEGQGQQYGLGALQGGSHTISDPGKLISALSAPVAPTGPEPAKYESPYAGKIGETLAAIQSRPSFNYNPANDTGLQAAQGSATDAVSRAAARRNMLYSDSNKSQMGKSALALVPQFRQQALGEYQQQGQDLYSQLQPLLQLENQNYGQFRDTVGDTRYANETTYSHEQDASANSRADAGAKFEREKFSKEFELANKKFLQDSRNEQARIGQTGANASRDVYNTNQSNLFKIWQNTGKAPAGIPGVPVGTPLYDKVDERQGVDPVMETALTLAAKDYGFYELSPEEQQKRIESLYAQLSKVRTSQPKMPAPITGLDKDILDALK